MRSEVKQPTYLFGTVAADHTVAVADSGDTCFEVELTGLGQEGWLTKVVQLEESRTTFDLGLHKGWWMDLK